MVLWFYDVVFEVFGMVVGFVSVIGIVRCGGVVV